MAISNNNVKNVVFLRNGRLVGSNTAAKEAMQAQLSGLTDGSIILGRYSGATGDVKTVAGLVYAKDGVKSLTFIDVEGASAEVQALREEIEAQLGTGITSSNTATSQLEALSGGTFSAGTSNSADTSVEGAKAYAHDYTDEQLDALDFELAGNENKVVYSVSQANGKLSATSQNITSIKLDGYAEGSDVDIAATDTLGQALGKLQGQINAMDLSVVSGDGEVIVSVSEEDGKVSATKSAIKDVKLTGYEKTSASGAISATDDVEDAISKIENNIAAIGAANTLSAADKSVNVVNAASGTTVGLNIRSGEKVLTLDPDATSGGVYTDIDLVKITTGLPADIKERYQLLASDDTQIGTNIDIPKDSHIVSINYITDSGDTHYQNLEYVYIDASGETKTTYIDMSELVLDVEVASGITADNHILRGVVDSASEKDESQVAFLTVGEDGFKISGIKDAIDTKINKLDADVSGNSTHVTVGVEEVDGKITAVTVSESNIANADDLATLSGKTITELTSANESITISDGTIADDGTMSFDIITDASKIKMSGFTSETSGFTEITEETSVTGAVKAIETAFIDNEEVTASALTDLNTKIEELSGGTSEDLAAEIAERRRIEGQSGSTYTANSSSSNISAATSLNDADVKLDAALKAVQDNYIGAVQVNGVELSETSNTVNVQVDAATSAMTSNNSSAIVVDTDETTGKITIGLNLIDCGEY